MSRNKSAANSSTESVKNEKVASQRPWYIRHARTLRTSLIWGGFFAILYYLSSFLSLFFLTFILAYTLNSLVNYLTDYFKWPRLVVVVEVYAVLVIILTAIGMIVIPRVYQEGRLIYKEIPEMKEKVLVQIKELMQSEEFTGFVQSTGLEEEFKIRFSSAFQKFTSLVQDMVRTSFHFILAVIFSFLILWDIERLTKDVNSLINTRLHCIYATLAPRLTEFGSILGKAFEAQIIIACVNTCFTFIGLLFLGIPSKLFLSVCVFICSFIPVLGVFISSTPICLIAYKASGFALVLYSILLITIIHFIEAYILNPRIVGGLLSLHPFVAVSILVFSEYFFGIWGLLLGVPCAVFCYHTLLVKVERHNAFKHALP